MHRVLNVYVVCRGNSVINDQGNNSDVSEFSPGLAAYIKQYLNKDDGITQEDVDLIYEVETIYQYLF